MSLSSFPSASKRTSSECRFLRFGKVDDFEEEEEEEEEEEAVVVQSDETAAVAVAAQRVEIG